MPESSNDVNADAVRKKRVVQMMMTKCKAQAAKLAVSVPRAELEKVTAEVERLEGALHRAQEDLSTCAAEKTTAVNQVSILERSVDDERTQIQKLQHELKIASNDVLELTDAQTKVAELEQRIEENDKHFTQHIDETEQKNRAQISDLMLQIDEERKKSLEAITNVDNDRNELNEARQRIIELEESIDKHDQLDTELQQTNEAALEEFQARISELEKQLLAQQKRNEEQQSEYRLACEDTEQKHMEAITSTNSELCATRERMQQLQREVAENQDLASQKVNDAVLASTKEIGEQAEHRIDELQNQNDILLEKNRKFHKLFASVKQLKQERQQWLAASEKIRVLEENFAHEQKVREDAEKNTDEWKIKFDQIMCTMNKNKAERQKLFREKSRLTNRVSSDEEAIVALQADIEQLKTQLDSELSVPRLDDVVARLQKKIVAQKQKLSLQQENIESYQEDAKRMNEDLEDSNREKEKLKTWQPQCDKLRLEIEKHLHEIDVLRSHQSESETAINDFQDEICTLREHIGSMERENRSLALQADTAEDLRAELIERKAEDEQSQIRLQDNENTIANLKAQINSLDISLKQALTDAERVEELDHDARQVTTQLQQCKRELSDMTAQFVSCRETRDALIADGDVLEAENQQLMQQVEHLNSSGVRLAVVEHDELLRFLDIKHSLVDRVRALVDVADSTASLKALLKDRDAELLQMNSEMNHALQTVQRVQENSHTDNETQTLLKHDAESQSKLAALQDECSKLRCSVAEYEETIARLTRRTSEVCLLSPVHNGDTLIAFDEYKQRVANLEGFIEDLALERQAQIGVIDDQEKALQAAQATCRRLELKSRSTAIEIEKMHSSFLDHEMRMRAPQNISPGAAESVIDDNFQVVLEEKKYAQRLCKKLKHERESLLNDVQNLRDVAEQDAKRLQDALESKSGRIVSLENEVNNVGTQVCKRCENFNVSSNELEHVHETIEPISENVSIVSPPVPPRPLVPPTRPNVASNEHVVRRATSYRGNEAPRASPLAPPPSSSSSSSSSYNPISASTERPLSPTPPLPTRISSLTASSAPPSSRSPAAARNHNASTPVRRFARRGSSRRARTAPRAVARPTSNHASTPVRSEAPLSPVPLLPERVSAQAQSYDTNTTSPKPPTPSPMAIQGTNDASSTARITRRRVVRRSRAAPRAINRPSPSNRIHTSPRTQRPLSPTPPLPARVGSHAKSPINNPISSTPPSQASTPATEVSEEESAETLSTSSWTRFLPSFLRRNKDGKVIPSYRLRDEGPPITFDKATGKWIVPGQEQSTKAPPPPKRRTSAASTTNRSTTTPATGLKTRFPEPLGLAGASRNVNNLGSRFPAPTGLGNSSSKIGSSAAPNTPIRPRRTYATRTGAQVSRKHPSASRVRGSIQKRAPECPKQTSLLENVQSPPSKGLAVSAVSSSPRTDSATAALPVASPSKKLSPEKEYRAVSPRISKTKGGRSHMTARRPLNSLTSPEGNGSPKPTTLTPSPVRSAHSSHDENNTLSELEIAREKIKLLEEELSSVKLRSTQEIEKNLARINTLEHELRNVPDTIELEAEVQRLQEIIQSLRTELEQARSASPTLIRDAGDEAAAEASRIVGELKGVINRLEHFDESDFQLKDTIKNSSEVSLTLSCTKFFIFGAIIVAVSALMGFFLSTGSESLQDHFYSNRFTDLIGLERHSTDSIVHSGR